MDMRLLGNSGTVVSNFALGTMTFGNEADERTSHRMMENYLSAGGNFIDTADIYNAGASEEIVGKWLHSNQAARNSMLLATKGRFPTGDGLNDAGNSRRHLRRALEGSLRRLGVEHVDLYQLHSWDPLTPLEESLAFLDDAVSSGLISYYGFSNFTGWQLTKAVWMAKLHNWQPPVTLQPQYNLLEREIESEIIPAALDAGLGLLPWSPLAGGWLTGKYRRESVPAGNTRVGENPTRQFQEWDLRSSNPRTWHILDALAQMASAHGAEPAQIALAWLAGRPGVTSVILGARTPEQLENNLQATGVELSEAETQRLDALSAPVVGNYPYGPDGVNQRARRVS
ncbi:aldo/keto reductase [Arthrobacter caoxuetaonis]|uniref:Aldo/keto reductase n=1 Tax=Arthrobacter caoxuetaonis TaxID=2886935 RepID=A0A9X1SD51_9MICC|nr:aldo/keto reductase [Arthrobacter caoxuetaonis]MCC3298331.1 aldo/keto reductase [Arthrobacter caoxuetaonis]USQ57652.1 aldo/keto reductase [Arthrobacter caoxuetaonis]